MNLCDISDEIKKKAKKLKRGSKKAVKNYEKLKRINKAID